MRDQCEPPRRPPRDRLNRGSPVEGCRYAGHLKKLNEETARTADELNHVRATILNFQPDYRIRAIVPKRPKKPSPYARQGGLMRTVMNALRQSPAAITARELAEHVLAARGDAAPDE